METVLINGLVADGDTTGIAHLDPDGIEYFYLPSVGYRRGYVMLTVDTSPPEPAAVWPLYFRQYFDKDYEYEGCGDTIVDSRDGTVYETVCIGNQTWMAENLKYDIGTNWCYDNDPAYCDTLRLYDWQTALTACPAGWHLPSEEEWLQLANHLGGVSVAGGKLKSITGWLPPNAGATNSTGFSSYGNGRYLAINEGFQSIRLSGPMWSSTESLLEPLEARTYKCYANFENLIAEYPQKTDGCACRCLKDQ